MMQQMIPVFDHHFLSTRAGFSPLVTSCEVPMEGNAITMAATVYNVAAITSLSRAVEMGRCGRTSLPLCRTPSATTT